MACNFYVVYIMNRKLQPDRRIHILHKRKPRFHDGTVSVDTVKYRLVGIPPSGREPPDVGLTRIRKAPHEQRVVKCVCMNAHAQ